MIPAIPLAMKALPWRLILLVGAFVAIGIWGAWERDGRKDAEAELLSFQLATQTAVAQRLADNQARAEALARKGVEIAAAVRKGKEDVSKAFQPAMADLQMLRTWWAAHAGGLQREPAADGAGALPGVPAAPGGPARLACTDRPGELVGAAYRVAQDLEACARDLARFRGLQDWVREVTKH